jgi:hypothetical protein
MTTHREYFKGMLKNLGVEPRIPALRAMAVVSMYESPGGDNHWNNPLASTQPWDGATPFNTFGDDNHVWRYLTPADGERAMALMMRSSRWSGVAYALKHSRTRGPILDQFSMIYTWVHVNFRDLDFNHYTAIHRRLNHVLQPYAPKDPWQ